MKTYKPYWIFAIAFSLIALLFCIVFTFNGFNNNTSSIGDTVGGITAPFLSIAGSILVFAALKAQIKANEEVQEQFREQKRENDKKDHEQKIYRLFDLHMDIVATSKISKRDIFVDSHTKKLIAPEYAGFEFHYKIRNQYKLINEYLEKNEVFDISMDFFEWTMFDGAEYYRTDEATPEQVLKSAHEFYYEPLSGLFFRYFNNVFMTLFLIDKSHFHTNKEKRQWVSLYLNHFSHSEIKWLFWVSFHADYIRYQSVLDKYGCFNRIKYDDLTTKSYWDFPYKYQHLQKRFEKVRKENGFETEESL